MIHTSYSRSAASADDPAPPSRAYLLPPGEGRSIDVLGGVASIKAASPHTGGACTIVEWSLPPGFRLAQHEHEAEDLALYVLEGTLEVACGDDPPRPAETGAFVLLPRGVSCALAVTEERPTRVLAFSWPAGLEDFLAEASQAETRRHLRAIAAKYRIATVRDDAE